MSAICQACGSKIGWVTMANSGRPMPVDDERVMVVQLSSADARALGLRRAGVITDEGVSVMGWLLDEEAWRKLADARLGGTVANGRGSHFSTCPEAPRFRKAARR